MVIGQPDAIAVALPHFLAAGPGLNKTPEEQFSQLPAEVIRKMTCENAGKFYGLMN
jgi:hypothetical protein